MAKIVFGTQMYKMRVMGELAIGLAKRQLKPDIAKCFDEIMGTDYETCTKYIISVEWK